MPVRALVVCLSLLLALAACQERRPYAERMASICQFEACSCQRKGRLLRIGKQPVKWRANGQAYCPEGYRIERDRIRGDR